MLASSCQSQVSELHLGTLPISVSSLLVGFIGISLFLALGLQPSTLLHIQSFPWLLYRHSCKVLSSQPHHCNWVFVFMKSAVLVCWYQSPWDVPSRVEEWRGSSSLATPPSQLNVALLCLHVASGCWGRARVYRLEKTRKKGLHLLAMGKLSFLLGTDLPVCFGVAWLFLSVTPAHALQVSLINCLPGWILVGLYFGLSLAC